MLDKVMCNMSHPYIYIHTHIHPIISKLFTKCFYYVQFLLVLPSAALGRGCDPFMVHVHQAQQEMKLSFTKLYLHAQHVLYKLDYN